VRCVRSALDQGQLIFGQFPSTSEWFWGPTSREQARRTLEHALDRGVGAIDTAPCYGWNYGETLIGEVVRNRPDVIVLTKCGLQWEEEHGKPLLGIKENGREYTLWRDLRPTRVRSDCEASLRRLRRDAIDVYQCHWPDPLTPLDDTLEELCRLREEGKIRELGLCNYSPEDVRRACEIAPISSVQEKFNLLSHRAWRDGRLDYYAALGVRFLAYAPFEQGLLTRCAASQDSSALYDGRREGRWLSPDYRRSVREALLELEPIRRGHNLTVAQMLLLWVLSVSGIHSVLVGMRSLGQVAQNVAVLSTRLPEDELSAGLIAFSAKTPKRAVC